MAIAPHKTHHKLTHSPHCAARATCHLRRAASHLGPGGMNHDSAVRSCAVASYWTASAAPSASPASAAPSSVGSRIIHAS